MLFVISCILGAFAKDNGRKYPLGSESSKENFLSDFSIFDEAIKHPGCFVLSGDNALCRRGNEILAELGFSGNFINPRDYCPM